MHSAARCLLAVSLVAGSVAAVPRSAVAQRPDLYRLSEDDRTLLTTLTLAYLTDDELHWHMNIDHNDPRSFFHGHHAYIQRLERYLIKNNAGHLVPLAKWNPGSAIPDVMNTVRFDQRPLENVQVGLPIPDYLQGDALRQFRTIGDLFRAVRPYHDAVHQRVGGAMADVMTASAAPIFFPWHAALDDIFAEWSFRTGYPFPQNAIAEFPENAPHGMHGGPGGMMNHGNHGGPGGMTNHDMGQGVDHGCTCGPKCKCGPKCRCAKRPGWKPPVICVPVIPQYVPPPKFQIPAYPHPHPFHPSGWTPAPSPYPSFPASYGPPSGYGTPSGYGVPKPSTRPPSWGHPSGQGKPSGWGGYGGTGPVLRP